MGAINGKESDVIPSDLRAYDSQIEHVDVDFGTYHHSTPEESNDIRTRAEKAFSML